MGRHALLHLAPVTEMVRVSVKVRRLPHGRVLALPSYRTDGSAGMDLAAATGEPLAVQPGETVRVPTGLAIAIPPGYEGQVRPRSGLASSSPLILPNSPGTIDSDYRGEIQVIMRNIGSEPFVIEPGMRIAQLVIAPVARAEWLETDELHPTERGEGGFGHTGRR